MNYRSQEFNEMYHKNKTWLRPSPQTQAEALVVLTWNQGSVILSDSVKKDSYTSFMCSYLTIIIYLLFSLKYCILIFFHSRVLNNMT
ncbi:hypothetical protein UFO1_3025 [Pelosinus sp. UFO1]|nr:hypothetical protein UFO1_3025 [Pelosinus sp. UFO1]